MIKLTNYDGKKHYVAPSAIACVTEAAASSQWHGINAIVKMFDGKLLEVNDTAESINDAIVESELVALKGVDK